MPEFVIPGYNIIKHIGTGGMCSVYLAEQLNFGRKVALKIMNTELAQIEDYGKRFLREARISASLSHPNIVTVYDTGPVDGTYYLALEYLPHGDLETRFSAGLSLEARLDIVEDIAYALDYAGSKGVVHRDIKPRNVMFRDDESVTIVDFGIARDLSTESGMTQIGTVLGTPHYMSPEQSLGKVIDSRSDLYSLGVILFELLTGSVPFTADSAAAIGVKHLSQEIPELPEDLEMFQPIIDKVLAKELKERYQTGEELGTDLVAVSETLTEEMRSTILKPEEEGSEADKHSLHSRPWPSSAKRHRHRTSKITGSRSTLRKVLFNRISALMALSLLLLFVLIYGLPRIVSLSTDKSPADNLVEVSKLDTLKEPKLVSGADTAKGAEQIANAGEQSLQEIEENDREFEVNLQAAELANKANEALKSGLLDEAKEYIALANDLQPTAPWVIADLEEITSRGNELTAKREKKAALLQRIESQIDSGELYSPSDNNAYMTLNLIRETTTTGREETTELQNRIDKLSTARISELLSQAKLAKASSEIDTLSKVGPSEVVRPLQQRYETLFQEMVKTQGDIKRLLTEAQSLQQSDRNTGEAYEQVIVLYMRVLKIDPGNATARSGLNLAKQQQLSFINAEMQSGKLGNARKFTEALKSRKLGSNELAQLENQLLQKEHVRNLAMEKLTIAKAILSNLEGQVEAGSETSSLGESHASTLIAAYKAAISAKATDASTPEIDAVIEEIELIYKSRFQIHITRKNYDLATTYLENLETSGIYIPSAIAMQEAMRTELNESTRVKKRSFSSF